MKPEKMKIAAIFIVFLMVFSSFAFIFVQTINPTPEKKVTLPTGNIVEHELEIDQERLALNMGKTIAKYYYYNGCLECIDKLAFLEYMASQFSGQIIIEKILTDSSASVTITSYYGQKILTNATQEEMMDAFCDLMIEPPIGCVTRKI